LVRTIDVNVEEAEDTMRRLGAVGLDMDDVRLALETEGVASFHKSFREVLAALDATARQPTRH
jgi:transaldolase